MLSFVSWSTVIQIENEIFVIKKIQISFFTITFLAPSCYLFLWLSLILNHPSEFKCTWYQTNVFGFHDKRSMYGCTDTDTSTVYRTDISIGYRNQYWGRVPYSYS